ncbi:MAG: bifunctional ornithine acetyltransferase/N-acetylglutamate synthase [Candidatus Gastranaerophilales bacterium]|nr:bifunctional ornithine acetyltransferase/N-acetylglutamate synthase [Candidatus Gastranaerophilales bacterium]
MNVKSDLKIIKGSITSPKGFKAAGKHTGLKKYKKDLAILFSESPANAAAVFTTNIVKAACVLWNKKIIEMQSGVQAIVVNSGNANACTGDEGNKHNKTMAEITAKSLGLKKEQVLVASTGVIGVPLPMDTIKTGIEMLCLDLGNSDEDGKNAAEAIMTTDTFTKEITVEFEIQGKTVTIAGMAKGSGMIHPNMATMLAFLTTDINITTDLLDKALKETVTDSYNMISVDGDTSTNDMVTILANGKADNELIKEENEDYKTFKKTLELVNTYLAQQIIRDGEGATKFLEAQIHGATTKSEARILAKSIITSSLVKAAFFGEDANWGRIIAAMGYSGAYFDQTKVDIGFSNQIGSTIVMQNGMPIKFDEDEALKILKEKDIKIIVNLQDGEAEATAWGCDLSYEYVKINGEYRT